MGGDLGVGQTIAAKRQNGAVSVRLPDFEITNIPLHTFKYHLQALR